MLSCDGRPGFRWTSTVAHIVEVVRPSVVAARLLVPVVAAIFSPGGVLLSGCRSSPVGERLGSGAAAAPPHP